jgi:hypothetical protein
MQRATPGALSRRQRKLAGQIREWLKRRPGALIDLGAGVRGQLRALLDQRQRRLRFQLSGTQQLSGLTQSSAELDQGISHAQKLIERALERVYN